LDACQGRPIIDWEAFTDIVRDELLTVSRVCRRQLVVPDWPECCQAIRRIFEEVAPDHHGANANSIPILRDADPEKCGVPLCSVDGQRFKIGDVDVYHSIQSVSKPLTYAHALARDGEASPA